MVTQTIRSIQNLSQRPTTTAHLAQTMTLLGLNNLELLEKIQGELASNPALEIIEDNRCPTCNRRVSSNQICPHCSFSKTTSSDDPIIFVSSRQDFSYSKNSSPENTPDEIISAEKEDLPTYILKQIAAELKPDERKIAVHILTGLDEDGFLTIPILEIARYHHVPPSKITKVLELIQKCDPVGVSASSPKEALLIQLAVIQETRKVDPLVEKIVIEGLEHLSKKQFGELAKLLNTSQQKIKLLANFISENLNPFPARAHWGNIRHQSDSTVKRYHKPDVLIQTLKNSDNHQLVVEVLWPIRGSLKINPYFQKAIADAPPDKLHQWNTALEQANLLIKCLSQRNHTMIQLMEKLCIYQKDFILKGNAHIHPLTRAQLAEEIGVHESTISRAVSNKSAQLPSGQIIPISKFFDRSLHIRTALKEIIAKEEKPLSDSKIAELLSQKGYNIARRTVAKYRATEGILPAHLRG